MRQYTAVAGATRGRRDRFTELIDVDLDDSRWRTDVDMARSNDAAA